MRNESFDYDGQILTEPKFQILLIHLTDVSQFWPWKKLCHWFDDMKPKNNSVRMISKFL